MRADAVADTSRLSPDHLADVLPSRLGGHDGIGLIVVRLQSPHGLMSQESAAGSTRTSVPEEHAWPCRFGRGDKESLSASCRAGEVISLLGHGGARRGGRVLQVFRVVGGQGFDRNGEASRSTGPGRWSATNSWAACTRTPRYAKPPPGLEQHVRDGALTATRAAAQILRASEGTD